MAIACAAALLGGCGGEDESPPSAAQSSAPPEGKAPPAGQADPGAQSGEGRASGSPSTGTKPASESFDPPPHTDSGGGAAQFRAPGGDNSIQDFGSEVDDEFAEAAAALHAYLDARAARAWSAACTYIASGLTTSLARLTAGAQQGGDEAPPIDCPTLLAALSAGIPRSALRQVAAADVASLRSQGDRGFLIFRGAEGVAYFMPMAKEDGRWKVAAIAASPLG